MSWTLTCLMTGEVHTGSNKSNPSCRHWYVNVMWHATCHAATLKIFLYHSSPCLYQTILHHWCHTKFISSLQNLFFWWNGGQIYISCSNPETHWEFEVHLDYVGVGRVLHHTRSLSPKRKVMGLGGITSAHSRIWRSYRFTSCFIWYPTSQ